MSNGQDMLEELNFGEKIKKMADRELLEFTARQVFEMSNLCPAHSKQIRALEEKGFKREGAVGGISGVIGASIVAILNYFTKGNG